MKKQWKNFVTIKLLKFKGVEKMAIERIIGIDFGTSTSVIRVKRYENKKPVGIGTRLDTQKVFDLVPTVIQEVNGPQILWRRSSYAKRKKCCNIPQF